MKLGVITLICAFGSMMFGQEVPVLSPKFGGRVDLSQEGEQEFIRTRKLCDSLWRIAPDLLTPGGKILLSQCSEEYDSYWDILGIGCSWYCGGGSDSVTASSFLKSNDTINYSPQNLHDLSYKTAWVEGVAGAGVGEKIIYHFSPESPRITTVLVVNGYVKSEKAWNENNRVKGLKVYCNDTPLAVLALNDTKDVQSFSVDPLGYGERDDYKKLKAKAPWTLTFEILEFYPGEKYDDTVITEIFFDGIDVH